MHAAQLAQQTIQQHQTRNPLAIAETLGIIVLFADLGTEIKGLYHKYRNQAIIQINNQLTPPEQRATCAHELAHALMHRESSYIFQSCMTIDSTGKYERQAWEFAAELLISDEIPAEYAGISTTEFAALLQCPVELMQYKTFPTQDGPLFY